MRAVTFRTSAVCNRRVSARYILYIFTQTLFMTRKTQGPLLIHNHPLDIASVRVMACETHSVCKRQMAGAFRKPFHKLFVALHAQFGTGCLEQFIFIRPVGIMACIT